MPNIQRYQDVWIRWIHSSWKNENGWRSDIRPSVLEDSTITKALFILDDHSCVFVPMAELKRVLAGKLPERNGSIIFNVNPRKNTVEETHVDLTIIESHSKRKKESAQFWESMVSIANTTE